MTIHHLKTVQPHYGDILRGAKQFEIRINDRDFKVGDTLILSGYDAERDCYLTPSVEARVSHILHGPAYGLMEGWVCMSIHFSLPTAIAAARADERAKIARWLKRRAGQEGTACKMAWTRAEQDHSRAKRFAFKEAAEYLAPKKARKVTK